MNLLLRAVGSVASFAFNMIWPIDLFSVPADEIYDEAARRAAERFADAEAEFDVSEPAEGEEPLLAGYPGSHALNQANFTLRGSVRVPLDRDATVHEVTIGLPWVRVEQPNLTADELESAAIVIRRYSRWCLPVDRRWFQNVAEKLETASKQVT